MPTGFGPLWVRRLCHLTAMCISLSPAFKPACGCRCKGCGMSFSAPVMPRLLLQSCLSFLAPSSPPCFSPWWAQLELFQVSFSFRTWHPSAGVKHHLHLWGRRWGTQCPRACYSGCREGSFPSPVWMLTWEKRAGRASLINASDLGLWEGWTCKLDTCTDLKSLWLQAMLAPSASKGELPTTPWSRCGGGSPDAVMPGFARKDPTFSQRPAPLVGF